MVYCSGDRVEFGLRTALLLQKEPENHSLPFQARPRLWGPYNQRRSVHGDRHIDLPRTILYTFHDTPSLAPLTLGLPKECPDSLVRLMNKANLRMYQARYVGSI
jgi:hypothetical protein